MKRYRYSRCADYTAYRVIPRQKRRTFVTLEFQGDRIPAAKVLRMCEYTRQIGGRFDRH